MGETDKSPNHCRLVWSMPWQPQAKGREFPDDSTVLQKFPAASAAAPGLSSSPGWVALDKSCVFIHLFTWDTLNWQRWWEFLSHSVLSGCIHLLCFQSLKSCFNQSQLDSYIEWYYSGTQSTLGFPRSRGTFLYEDAERETRQGARWDFPWEFPPSWLLLL